MAKLKATPKNFEQARKVLGDKGSIRLGNNTYLELNGEHVIAVRLHQTDIVKFYDDGRVTLYAGKWRTVTTKDRLNEFTTAYVFQTGGKWWVRLSGMTVAFEDGMNVGETHLRDNITPDVQLNDPPIEADFRVQNEGSIFLLHVLTPAAKDWVAEHIGDCQWFGCAVVVEHRYIADIVNGIRNDGLEVE